MIGEVVCGYKLLRELGSRAIRAYAAIDPKPRREGEALCVVEQLAREPGVSAEAAAEFLRDAKRLAAIKHPNLAHVRDVVVGTNTVLCVSDWIDGEQLEDVTRLAAERSVPVPLGVSLRTIVDLLEGLSALHELRDAKRAPLGLVHAEVAPRNVVVALDGSSVLVHPLRGATARARKPAPEVVGYLAPEVLLGDLTADQRADVYGVGVLLWEALMGRQMHAAGEAPGEIVVRLLGGKIDPPSAPIGAPWAAGLVDVVKRATSPDPGARYANAAQMLAEVRRVAGAKLAPRSSVAALVEIVAGARVRNRVATLGAAGELRLRTLQPGIALDKATPPPIAVPIPMDAPRPEPTTPTLPPIEPVDVVELDVAPDAPARPAARPPPPPSTRSRTDLSAIAALHDVAPIAPARPRAKVAVLAACAAAALVAAWVIGRPAPKEEPTASPAAAPIAPTPPAVPAATSDAPAIAPSASPLGDELPWPAESAHPAPAPPATGTGSPRPNPSPSPSASPIPTASPSPAPAPAPAPPPKKKPRAYDPQGI